MTYSIVAYDPQTQEIGVAVQSRYFAAGRMVPWLEAGVGAVATQFLANPRYGYEGLRLLRSGMSAQDALARLIREDAESAARQVAIFDAQGRFAQHTGAACPAETGQAHGLHCAAQANGMTRNTVWSAMVSAFEQHQGLFAERLLAALEAAEQEGGDIRGKQAATLLIASAIPETGSKADYRLDLRIDDHPDPVAELQRLFAYDRAHRKAGHALEKMARGDIPGAAGDLEACCVAYPDEPEFLGRYALLLLATGRLEEARRMMKRAMSGHPGWGEYLLRMADTGIYPFTRAMVAPLIQG